MVGVGDVISASTDKWNEGEAGIGFGAESFVCCGDAS